MDGVGVDGCPGGWIAAAVDGRRVEWRLFGSFREILKAYPKTVIAVDTPIGTAPAGGRRDVDAQARAWLAAHHGLAASVFFAPDDEHLRLWRADPEHVHPRGAHISIQSWNIADKIVDVADTGVGPGHRWVVEAHPEISFRVMPDSSVRAGKKTRLGAEQRVATLQALGWKLPSVNVPLRGIFEDALDATAIAWTAVRHGRDTSRTLPKKPGKGPRIVY